MNSSSILSQIYKYKPFVFNKCILSHHASEKFNLYMLQSKFLNLLDFLEFFRSRHVIHKSYMCWSSFRRFWHICILYIWLRNKRWIVKYRWDLRRCCTLYTINNVVTCQCYAPNHLEFLLNITHFIHTLNISIHTQYTYIT